MTFAEITARLMGGFGTTCLLFIATLVLSLPLGLLITFGSITKFKPVRYIVRGFIWIIRGTPLMLQIFVVFYVPMLAFNAGIESRTLAALIAFIINYSCYFSEIFRGGIESVPRGQWEACQVLGLTKTQAFFRVILMQVVKHIVPPMSNEIITLVKDTSLARVIGVIELIQASEKILAQRALVWPLFYAGAFYLIFSGILTILFNKLEKKLDYYHV